MIHYVASICSHSIDYISGHQQWLAKANLIFSCSNKFRGFFRSGFGTV